MKTIGNLIWFVLSGLWLGLGYFAAGIVSCLTLIGIPFGIQSFKLAVYVMWPFGQELVPKEQDHLLRGILNIVWIVVGGFWLALFHIVLGLILSLSILGLPFGIKNFSMAKLALFPFAYSVTPKGMGDPNSGPLAD